MYVKTFFPHLMQLYVFHKWMTKYFWTFISERGKVDQNRKRRQTTYVGCLIIRIIANFKVF